MPPFPIVDAHVHFWDPERMEYPWLSKFGVPLQRAQGLEEFRAATEGIEVEKLVFVECDVAEGQELDEVRFVTELAQSDPRIAGIVAAVRLEGETSEVRARLDELKKNRLVKGVRRLLQSEETQFPLRDDFLAGVRLLSEYDFTFDVCVRHEQLSSVVEMVRRCPDVSFVLDHVGKPAIRAQEFDPWRDELHELASFRNVHCKLSGLVTEAEPQTWTEEDLNPYVAHVLDSFGPSRVIFGGDWPVSTLASDYRRWLEAAEGPISVLPENEQKAIFRGNAIRFYRLAD